MGIAIIAGIFGLFIGSLLNVIHYRFGAWKSIIFGRSHCMKCKHLLAWFDLVPVVSFVSLNGRCRYCHKKISGQYPLVELLAGFSTFVIWLGATPNSFVGYLHLILLLVFAYSIVLMVIDDFKSMEVPDVLFLTSFISGVLAAISSNQAFSSTIYGVLVAAGPLALLVFFSREKWMGWGDVFIAIPIGVILGFPLGLTWLYLSFILGGAIGLVLLSLKIKGRKDPVPFIPILFISFLIVYLWGNQIVDWYMHLSYSI